MTNKEWLQGMDTDTLAEFIIKISGFACNTCYYNNSCYDESTETDFCILGVKLWLEEENENN
jgi:hypothetical protein